MVKKTKRKLNWEEGMKAYWNYTIAVIAALVSGYAVYKLTKSNDVLALSGIVILIFVLLLVGIGLQIMVNSRKD